MPDHPQAPDPVDAPGGGPRTATRPPPGLAYRPIEEADLPFLAELYASTRRDEVAQVPWSDEEKEAFLRWQFESQHQHYQTYYPECEFLVIEAVRENPKPGGEEGEPSGTSSIPRTSPASGGTRRRPIGRLYLDRWDDEIRLVDIALLPEHRGSGLGTAILERVLAEGRQRGVAVSIHVEYNNPALSLYRRLGFRHVDSNGVYYLMRWDPEGGEP